MTDLSDSEIDAICAGLVQNAAKVRYLRKLGLTVRQKPNGKPLVNRAHFELVTTPRAPEFQPDASMLAVRLPFKQSGLRQWQAKQREAAEARTAFLESLPAPTADQKAAMEAERRQQAVIARAALVRFHAARRRVVKLQRTPPWADQKQILSVYRRAKRITDATGVQHHVDHIYPLQGKLVSGLHVENNLQVIPWRDNILKRNHFEVTE